MINFSDPQVWVAIAFLLFFIAFGKMIWIASMKVLDSQILLVKNELNEANKIHMDAKDLVAKYNKQLTKLESNSIQEIEESNREAQKIIEKSNLRLEESILRLEKLTIEKINNAEKEAVNIVKKDITEIAISLASHSLKNGLVKEDHAKLISDSLNEASPHINKL